MGIISASYGTPLSFLIITYNFKVATPFLFKYNIAMVYLLKDIEIKTESELNKLMEFLPPERKSRAMKYKFLPGKTTCVLAYLLFLYGYRKEFSHMDTPDFSVKENGKPYLAHHPEIHFNISHCKNAIACAFSDEEIGIDIQEIRKVSPSHMEKICSAEELSDILSANSPDAEFCKTWSIKEAISKCSGEGIFKSLHSQASNDYHILTRHIEPDMYMTTASIKEADLTIQYLDSDALKKFFL